MKSAYSGGGKAATALLALVVSIQLAYPLSAEATFPGKNGKIAFDREGNRGYDIFTMNLDGTELANLTNGVGSNTNPAWSPDGAKIAFNRFDSSTDGIFVMNADGSHQTQLSANPGGLDGEPAWSPDGRRIAFRRCNGQCDVFVMNSDGTGQTNLTNNPSYDVTPSWSPDGKKIAFHSSRGGVWVMNPDGSGQAQLVSAYTPGSNSEPDWSPDGSKLAFMSYEISGTIHKVNRDGSGVTALTFGAYPAWSPDGSKLAFSRLVCYRTAPCENDIFVVNSDGSDEVNITNSTADDAHSSWQPIPNRPPDCSAVEATPSELEPANRKLRLVSIGGASDPDGDAVTLTVRGVVQDEPVTSHGDPTSPDATPGPQGDQVNVRAERNPQGDGRVYRITFEASDGAGGSCSGTTTVEVRRHNAEAAVDSAPPSYDSFAR
jgi:Tol biopolymer transport system component